jgi:hypothetical protein
VRANDFTPDFENALLFQEEKIKINSYLKPLTSGGGNDY